MRKSVGEIHPVLEFDRDKEIDKICRRLKNMLGKEMRKRGFVIALSGGVDSSVSAALAVAAVGQKKVFGILLPEKDSSPESVTKGKLIAEHLGIEYQIEDIAPTLEAIGCYRRRDEAIRILYPDYADGWKSKIAITGGLDGRYTYFKLVVQAPNGDVSEAKLGIKEYLQIVAATNYKQRIRKTIEYFHADRLNYAVIGTPNRLEYDQGFFVKNGDGAADLKPIAHLYKSQVYALAWHFGLPEEICTALPTTDTYSLAQGQDEFYFGFPYKEMDIILWAYNNNKTPKELSDLLHISVANAEFALKDVETKRKATAYLHSSPLLIEDIDLGTEKKIQPSAP